MRFGSILFFYSICGALAKPPTVTHVPAQNRPVTLMDTSDVIRPVNDYKSCVETVYVLTHSTVALFEPEHWKEMEKILFRTASDDCRKLFPTAAEQGSQNTAPSTSGDQCPDYNALAPNIICKPRDYESCVKTLYILASPTAALLGARDQGQYLAVLREEAGNRCKKMFPRSPNKAGSSQRASPPSHLDPFAEAALFANGFVQRLGCSCIKLEDQPIQR